jgi:hypothetical protein
VRERLTLRRMFAIAVACSFSTSQLAGAQRQARGPDDVVRAVLRADSVGDWRSILALAHPDAIAEFRKSRLLSLAFDTTETFMMRELSQCMKDEIARSQRMQLDSIYRVSSIDALARLPADTVFARHRRWMAHLPRTFPADSLMPRKHYSYLGHVMADDSTAYGIIIERWNRLPTPDWPGRRPLIITLRRLGPDWRTMLDADFLEGGVGIAISEGC